MANFSRLACRDSRSANYAERRRRRRCRPHPIPIARTRCRPEPDWRTYSSPSRPLRRCPRRPRNCRDATHVLVSRIAAGVLRQQHRVFIRAVGTAIRFAKRLAIRCAAAAEVHFRGVPLCAVNSGASSSRPGHLWSNPGLMKTGGYKRCSSYRRAAVIGLRTVHGMQIPRIQHGCGTGLLPQADRAQRAALSEV